MSKRLYAVALGYRLQISLSNDLIMDVVFLAFFTPNQTFLARVLLHLLSSLRHQIWVINLREPQTARACHAMQLRSLLAGPASVGRGRGRPCVVSKMIEQFPSGVIRRNERSAADRAR